ncbi:MAG: hypothetical protein JWP57_2569 [Spirosoma sp.]|nr:hypothetical protein [Spirosoma sp.]
METLRYVMLANGLLAVVSLVFYVLLRRETFFEANRLALWLGLIASLVMPLVQLPDWRPQPVKAVMQQTARVIVPQVFTNPPALQPDVTNRFPYGRAQPAFPERLVRSGWSWQLGLIGLYLTVLIVLLVRFGFRLLALMRLIRQSVQEPYDDFILVRNTGVTSPFSFFGWVVLNPNQHTPNELENILRHERVHVRAWHSVDMLGAELLSIVFWFNPAAYLFRQLVHQTLEFSADRAVLAEGIDPQMYQRHLVKVSLAAGQSVITNHFSQSLLRERVGMMNREQSGYSALGRYVVWTMAVGMMMVACKHGNSDDKQALTLNTLPANSPTRALVVELEDKNTWYRHFALYKTRFGTRTIISDPAILCIKGNQLAILDDHQYESAVYINGKETSVESLSQIAPENVRELFVMHQWDDRPNIDRKTKPYQILIQTSATPLRFDRKRRQFFTFLQAAAISQHPRGETYMFTMNSLLEATFFHNKNALVERTKNEHLKLYDEFKDNVDIFINELPATVADVETVHVREVARLYTKERPYTDWFRAKNPQSRFELHIQTAPKRAKRDSTYYVFSPFYSGDF